MIWIRECKRRTELMQVSKLRVSDHMVVVFCLNQPIFTHDISSVFFSCQMDQKTAQGLCSITDMKYVF